MFNFGFSPSTNNSSSGLWFTFFTQGNAIYKQLPEQVKNTIEKDQFDPKINIKFPNHFEPCTGKSKVCWKTIQNQFYYVCEDCKIHSNSCICEQCFDQQKHKGHKFYKHKGKGFCDCGFEERWKKQGFCEKHGQYTQSEQKLDPEIKQRFSTFYTGSMRLFIELINLSYNKKWNIKNEAAMKITQQYGQKLFTSISVLCSNSPEYEELTYQILMTKAEEEKTILDHFIELQVEVLKKTASTFIISMFSHKNFLLTCSEIIFKKYTSRAQLNKCQFAKNFYKIIIQRVHILNELAEREVVIFNNTLSNEGISDIYQFYGFYFTVLKKSLTFQKSIYLPVWKCLHKKGLLKFEIMKKMHVDLILDDIKGDNNFIIQILKSVKQKGFQKKMINIIDFINTILRTLSQNYENEEKIQEYFQQIGIKRRQLEAISSIYFQKLLESQRLYEFESIKILIRLIKKYGNVQQFFKGFWEQMQKNCSNDFNFVEFTAQIIFQFVGQEIKNTYQLYKYKKSEKQELQTKLQLCFKEYLCMKKIVRQSELMQMKQMKWLSFPNAGNILHSMTEYYESRSQFKYTSSEKYYKPQIYLLQIKSNYIEEVSSKQNIFSNINEDIFFVIESIYGTAFDIFNKKEQAVVINTIHNAEYVRILNAIIISHILKGQNKYIQEYIAEIKEKIMENPQNKQTNKHISRLLGISQNNEKQEGKEEQLEEKKEVQNMEQTQNVKKKKKKKEIILQKYEKKRGKVMQSYEQQLQKEQVCQEKQQKLLCIICKDSETQSKPMYYMGKSKKSVVLNSLFGNALVSNIMIDTCFHTIHLSCFDEYSKQSDICPLCNQVSNCIFPLSVNRDEEYYRTWKNNLIYLCIKNSIMKVDKIPILILKNLIMRSGILSLLHQELKEFDKKKLNYFKNLLLNTYEMFEQRKQKELDKTVNVLQQKMLQTFKQLILKNSDSNLKNLIANKEIQIGQGLSFLGQNTSNLSEMIVRKIQILFLQTYKSLLKKDSNFEYLSSLKQLSCFLNKKDFSILVNSFAEILSTTIQLEIPEENKKSISINNLFCLTLPEKAQQVLDLVQKCSSCQSLRAWYCVNCKITFCYECDMINDHKNEIHPEFFVIIILHTGKVRIVRRGRSEEFHIYVNFFMENWDGKNDTSEFFINKPKYDKCLYSMLLEE